MSFSAVLAGKQADVRYNLGAVHPSPFGTERLGELTRDYLAAVAQLALPDRGLIVEASGHSDPYGTSLNIRVVTVSALAPAPQDDINPEVP